MKNETTISLPRIARKRKSYAERSGMVSRVAKIAAKAANEKIDVYEDADGNRIRRWRPEEMSAYSHDDIASVLRGRHVIEPEDVLEHIPPSAIKYAKTKGWLRPSEMGSWLYVTERARFELKLPSVVRGRKIRFAP